jgi:hypothetical protein
VTNTFFATAHPQQKVIRVDLYVDERFGGSHPQQKVLKVDLKVNEPFAAADPRQKKIFKVGHMKEIEKSTKAKKVV